MFLQRNVRLLLFIALTSFSALGFELLQTRVLSALYFNNVVYMTVTIALLGFGISGVIVSILQNRSNSPERAAAYCAAGLSVSMLICIYVASSLPSKLEMVPTLYKMMLSYFFLVVPFLFAGSALSLIFMQRGKEIFALYFVDLGASSLAVILFCWLLWPIGAANFVWIFALIALLAFLIQVPRGEIRRIEIVIFTSLFIFAYLFVGPKIINNQPEFYKSTARFYQPNLKTKLEASAWTPIAKIDVFSNQSHSLLSGEYLGHPDDLMYLAQDNDAPTYIFNNNNINRFATFAKEGRPIEVKVLAYFLNKQPQEVLVIGIGGGVDIVQARTYGAKHIDGVEINPATIDFLTQHFRDYARWPLWKDVAVFNAEGRHFVRKAKKKYDVIMMSGVDTFSALNSGAYVLSENYLYTVEAIKDYLNLLKPDGIMAIARWFFVKPRETLRLANLFVYAAPFVGRGPADQRIMVINSNFWAVTLIKPSPFTSHEVETIALLVKKEGYDWIYIPKVLGKNQMAFEKIQFEHNHDRLAFARNAFQSLITAPTLAKRHVFEEAYPYKINPVYDDKPFFFEYYKGLVKNQKDENWQGRENDSFRYLGLLRGPLVHYVLYILLFLTTLTCVLSMGVPLIIFEKRGIHIHRVGYLFLFFCSLGLGFMFVEIGSMQWLNLYLGNPMYSLMVVLGSLLLFAGVGSLLAGKLQWESDKKIRFGMLATAVLIPIWWFTMKWIMPQAEYESTLLRVIIVFISLIPLSVCMGIPFASGLKYLADHHAKFISWAWGINGISSVAASILAIILAMKFGFTLILLSSSFIYVIGYLAFYIFNQHNRGILHS